MTHIRMSVPIDVMPYVRMTTKQKYYREDAQKYLRNQREIRLLVQNIMQLESINPIPDSTPFYMRVVFFEPRVRHNRDLDNMAKAVLDAVQGYLFKNDCWCDRIQTERRTSDLGTNSFTLEIGVMK